MKDLHRQIALEILDGSTIKAVAEKHGMTQTRVRQALRHALILVAPEMNESLPKRGAGSRFGRATLDAIMADRSELAEKIRKA